MKPERKKITLDDSVAFADREGQYKKGLEKSQRKTLAGVIPLLLRAVEPGEVVLMAVRACSPMGFWEPLGMMRWAYVMKRCVLVLTDRRVLHFPTDTDYEERGSVAEIRFGDIESARAASFFGRAIVFRYKNGKTERFAKMKRADHLRFMEALGRELATQGRAPTPALGRAHVCPRCATRLVPGTCSCPKCFLAFKDMASARRYAILFPGGGYFYTGQWGLGLLDAFAEALLIALLLVGLFDPPEGPHTGLALALIAAALAAEKLLTIYHATHRIKEFLPKDPENALADRTGGLKPGA